MEESMLARQDKMEVKKQNICYGRARELLFAVSFYSIIYSEIYTPHSYSLGTSVLLIHLFIPTYIHRVVQPSLTQCSGLILD